MNLILLTVVLSWSAPTERENGDPLPANQIAEYEVKAECGSSTVELFSNIEDLTYTLPVDYGYCKLSVRVSDHQGLWSRWSKSVEPNDTIQAPTSGGFR